jgi:hypothetical protein
MIKLTLTQEAIAGLEQCSSPQFKENLLLSDAIGKLSAIDDLGRADIPTLSEVLKLLKATKESAATDRIIERECRCSTDLLNSWQEVLSTLRDSRHRLHNPALVAQLTEKYGAAFSDLERLTKQLTTIHQQTLNDLDGIAATRVLLGAVVEVALPQATDALRLAQAELHLYEKQVKRAEEMQRVTALLEGPVLQLECKLLDSVGDGRYGKSGYLRAVGAFYSVVQGEVWRVEFSITAEEKGKPWPKTYRPGDERYLNSLAELNQMLSPWLGRGLQATDCGDLKRVYNEDLPHELLIKALLEQS